MQVKSLTVRKVIKILGKVAAAAILLLVLLPLALSLLLDIPAVQNFVVHKAAALVSRKLETTVSIGRVDIGLFNKLRAEEFYVEDYQRDTLLFADRLEAVVTGFGIFSDGLVLGSVRLEGAKLCLRETPSGEMNIKQLVDRLNRRKKKKKREFRLTVSSASIDGMEFCLERRNRKNPPHGIDFGHLHLYDMHAYATELVLEGPALSMDIRSLGASERSGFDLKELSGRFFLASGCIGFEEATIRTHRSELNIPHISLVGNSWADYKDFLGEVLVEASVRQSRLATDDAAYFAPGLRDWHTTFHDINLGVEGTVSNFKATLSGIGTGARTRLAAEAEVRGLPDVQRTHFDLDIRSLATTAADIDQLAAGIGRKELSDKLLQIIERAGQLDLTGRFTGTLSSFRMQATLATLAGRAECNLTVSPREEDRRSVQGEVAAYDVRLGDLLGNPGLGSTTLRARVDGVAGRGFTDANIKGEVRKFEFKGYAYDSLQLDGHLFNKEFDGRITARDRHLNFDFAGIIDFNDSVPSYDFALELRKADLAAMHINRRDSISTLSARLAAKGSGRSFDDLNGVIRITDAVYRYNDSVVDARQILLRGVNSSRSKFVELRSDFADVTFRSQTSYRAVFEYLEAAAWRYLPMLYDREKAAGRNMVPTAAANDFSLLSVDVKNINPVMDAIAQGLQLADGSRLQLLFNPASDQLALTAASDFIERNRLLATKIRVNATNRGDSLALYAASEDFYLGMLHLQNLSVTGGAQEGRLQLTTGFNDTTEHFSGLFSIAASLAEESGPDGRVLDVRILPSHLTRRDKTWQIFARRIAIDTARVDIDRFYVRNNQQELLVDGVASREQHDSLVLRLRNFDLAPFTQIVQKRGYSIEGVTNGSAKILAALGRSEITADIRFDSLEVNDLPVPPLRLVSNWDSQRNRAGVLVSNRRNRDTLVQGFYIPSEARYYARMEVDGLDVGLLDPVLKGVVSATTGAADVRLTLRGRRRDADLSGRIRVTDLSTKVDFTQVTYRVPEVTLEVKDNHLVARDVALFDPEGNRGSLGIDLNLQHLSNLGYSVRVRPERMLVLNTTPRDNDTFYGKIYASGVATITGDKAGVNMDITATTEDRSSFILPLSGKSDISNADFVIFESARPSESGDAVSRRKRLFERRQKTRSAARGAMNIALALNVRPNLDLELDMAGSVLRGRGEGTLNLEVNPRQNVFEMYGDYTITEGSYNLSLQNLISRKFVIENGSTILWTGSPMNALLDINAVYKLKASLTPLLSGTTTNNVSGDRSVPVECVIHLGDRLSNPDITFSVRVPQTDPETQAVVSEALATPETMNTQFFYLLVFNSFLSEDNTAGAGFGTSSVGTGIEFLTNQLSKLLSTSDYNVVLRYRPKSDLTSDELDFGLSKSLINDRLFVEVEGNYILDNSQAVNRNMSNFMGEAYITWLIDRAGTLRLRAFTQTIDRFDENQGLQETGIGIYYKEDFDTFKDLRERIRDRFSSRKRRNRRAAEQTARDSLARIGDGVSARVGQDTVSRADGEEGVHDGNREDARAGAARVENRQAAPAEGAARAEHRESVPADDPQAERVGAVGRVEEALPEGSVRPEERSYPPAGSAKKVAESVPAERGRTESGADAKEE